MSSTQEINLENDPDIENIKSLAVDDFLQRNQSKRGVWLHAKEIKTLRFTKKTAFLALKQHCVPLGNRFCRSFFFPFNRF